MYAFVPATGVAALRPSLVRFVLWVHWRVHCQLLSGFGQWLWVEKHAACWAFGDSPRGPRSV